MHVHPITNRFCIVDVIDHWFRVCSQRKGMLEDESNLQLSLQVVLNNAHRILNKREEILSFSTSLSGFPFFQAG
jgi:tyrosine-protein phosphatase non-receptor type 23